MSLLVCQCVDKLRESKHTHKYTHTHVDTQKCRVNNSLSLSAAKFTEATGSLQVRVPKKDHTQTHTHINVAILKDS